jgi:hypothetical protein
MPRVTLFLPLLSALIGCTSGATSDDPGDSPPDTGGEQPFDADADGFSDDQDCDDADADVFPDAPERCNQKDDDCDGRIDEDAIDAMTWWTDADGDGYGAGPPISGCEMSDADTSLQEGDCDDMDPAVYPGAPTVIDDAVDQDCDGRLEETRWATTPVAPTPDEPMWPTLQTRFLDQHGELCTGSVTLFVHQYATCFAGRDGDLRCMDGDGAEPVTDAGLDGVTMTESYTTRAGDMHFALVGGTLWARGANNTTGWAGNGTTDAVPDWTAWPITDVTGFATDGYGALCVITEGGTGFCAGTGFGPTPALVTEGASHVWMDWDAEPNWNSGLPRVSAGPQDAFVTEEGLAPWHREWALGTPGHVVSGSYGFEFYIGSIFWLEDDGSIYSYEGPEESMVKEEYVQREGLPAEGGLLLAGNEISACAVYTDGSVWCFGDSSLWTTDSHTAWQLVELAPAGTVDTRCE